MSGAGGTAGSLPRVDQLSAADREASVARWLAGFATVDGDAMPPHHPGCLGCGPDNPHGHRLQVHRDGDAVRTGCTFDERHMGAPGIAHGGAVATVMDDLLGFLLFVVREPGVTRHLEVSYRKPVVLGQLYDGVACLERREGRKLFCTGSLTGPDGVVAVEAKGLFLVVGLEHFQGSGATVAP